MDGLNFATLLAAYEFDFTPVWEGIPKLLQGLWVTIALTITVMLLSLPLGLGVAFVRLTRSARFAPLRLHPHRQHDHRRQLSPAEANPI